jgi:hypothetical protein
MMGEAEVDVGSMVARARAVEGGFRRALAHDRGVRDGVGVEAEEKRRHAASLTVKGRSRRHDDGGGCRWSGIGQIGEFLRPGAWGAPGPAQREGTRTERAVTDGHKRGENRGGRRWLIDVETSDEGEGMKSIRTRL